MKHELTFAFDALRSIDCLVSVAYEGQPQPQMRSVAQWNPNYTFWVLKQGRAELHLGSTQYRASKGQWILVPPNLHRRHILTENVELISLSFQWNWPLGEPVLALEKPRIGRAGDEPQLCAQARRVIRLLPADALQTRTTNVMNWLAFQRELQGFLAVMSSVVIRRGWGSIAQPGAVDERLDKILSDLAAAPTAGPLPYAWWTRSTGIGRQQIDRLAREHLGVTLSTWRNRLLAREIRRRLLMGSAVIKSVASNLGFVDSAHFNRWCRQHLNEKPSALRSGGQA